VRLAEVVDFNPKPARGSYADDLEVSFVPMAAVEAGSGRMDPSCVRTYGQVKKGFTHFCEGDVLFAKITPCMENGKMAVAAGLRNGIGFGSTEFHVLRPRSGLDAAYLYHFVSAAAYRREAAHHMTGAVGQKRVPLTFLECSKIPLPTVQEQRRIVAEIEKQFSRLDEAVANLRSVKANLLRLRQSCLNEAVSGWQKRPLGRLLREPLRNGHSAKASADPAGLRAFTLTAVTTGDFSISNTKPTVATPSKVADLWAEPGDIYVERSNTPELVGTTRLYKGPPRFAFIPDLLIRVRVDRSILLPEYAEVSLQSDYARTYFRGRAQGISGSMPKIDQRTIESFEVPLPPLSEQRRIVAEVDRRLSVVCGVEAEVDANLKRAQALRQAVLARAFNSEEA
jgi:type I restriction enzyme S subunit